MLVYRLIYLLRVRFRFSFCLSRDFIGFSRCFPLTPTFSECTGSQDKTAVNKSDLKWLRHATCTYAFCACLLETSLLIPTTIRALQYWTQLNHASVAGVSRFSQE